MIPEERRALFQAWPRPSSAHELAVLVWLLYYDTTEKFGCDLVRPIDGHLSSRHWVPGERVLCHRHAEELYNRAWSILRGMTEADCRHARDTALRLHERT